MMRCADCWPMVQMSMQDRMVDPLRAAIEVRRTFAREVLNDH